MYQRILVPVDGSATSERGLREAVKLASGQSTRLLFLHVVDDYTTLSEMTSAAGYEEMLKRLRQYGLDVLAKAKHEAEAASIHCETLLREVTGKRVLDKTDTGQQAVRDLASAPATACARHPCASPARAEPHPRSRAGREPPHRPS